MGGGDEEKEEQKKLQNLGFEASNPKRKKDLPQTLKFFRPLLHGRPPGMKPTPGASPGFFLTIWFSRMVKKKTLLTNIWTK